MSYLSPSQTLCLRIMTLGEQAGRLYHAIWNEITFLRVKWDEYRILFRGDNRQIALLNHVAPFFFSRTQTLMVDDIILHLSRITGPIKSIGRHNLTIDRLPTCFAASAAYQDLSDVVSKAKASSVFARDRRNRRIAHADLDLAINASAVPPDPVTYQMIDDAIEDLWRIVVFVEAQYFRTSLIEFTMKPTTGSEALLRLLSEVKAPQTGERKAT